MASTPPPSKKARNVGPVHGTASGGQLDMPGSNQTTNGSLAIRPHASSLDAKGQARRIKSKLRDRAKALAKTGEEPIYYDVRDLLGADHVDALLAQGPEAAYSDKFARGHEETVVIQRLGAHGDGLAVANTGDWVIAVPHALPGEIVVARIYSNERLYSRADLVRIVEHAAETSASVSAQETRLPVKRRDDLVQCKYFGQCSGCQYQNIDYATQLDLKRTVVERAFRHFSGLPLDCLPEVLPTLGSPLQYSYRTKLTPHFELPRELRRGRRDKGKDRPSELSNGGGRLPDVAIGFDKLGEKAVLDIEECSIATKAINEALPGERHRIKSTIDKFKNGATILLRDSLQAFDHAAKEDDRNASSPKSDTVVVTDHHASVKESVGKTKFLSPAGAFFQNNRSILPGLLSYVQEQIAVHSTQDGEKYLVDAYCGSGLFSLCLADLFTRVAGIEISQESIKCAKENAQLNGNDNVDFVAGDAMEIFKKISFPSSKTTVIIDPPRRGCDEPFIRQLLELGPQLIVYVSCNVHTQARDVGQIVRGTVEPPNIAMNSSPQYEILSIRGADLFPQTYHVEGVCILRRTSRV